MTAELILANATAQLVLPQTAPLAAAGSAADRAATRGLFADYRDRQAERTLDAHDDDLARLALFLADAGLHAGDLANDPAAWPGLSWGLLAGFVRWQLAEGYAIGSINRSLSTIKTYAKLAFKAGTIDATTYALIRAVEGYRHTEGKRIDTRRERTRLGAKKATPTAISAAQAEKLKQQPDTPQGRRDALLMCILLDHGLRCGEVEILPADAIDLDAGTLHFYRPKVDIEQTHQLSADALRAAVRYLRDLPHGDTLIRGSRRGGQLAGSMGTRAINARVQLLGAAIGLGNLSPHDCRHFWATAAIRGGTDIKSLQDAGGWASPAMPLRYAESAKIANAGVRLG